MTCINVFKLEGIMHGCFSRGRVAVEHNRNYLLANNLSLQTIDLTPVHQSFIISLNYSPKL